jgi:hypothetical protein
MAQEYEFDVANELSELEFVWGVSPMAASDKGYDSSEDIHRRYANQPFENKFDEEMNQDGDEYPALYQVSFHAPEEDGRDFDQIMTEVEEVVNKHHPTACIGNYDSGVPANDWSGWDIDPIVDVLCVRDLSDQ